MAVGLKEMIARARSEVRAAAALQEMGFANVVAMEAGLNGWREEGLPVDEAT